MSAPDLFAADAPATPMMAQYLAVKAQHPDVLLFYRMGDFYEMFFADALAASAALDIALTKRGQHQGQDVPMCGVPVHSHTTYVARLIKKGFRVAICEQTETPAEAKKRGGKALVAREVVRIITPGTLTEDQLLEARTNNHLLVLVAAGREGLAAAWCDVSTGVFETETLPRAQLAGLLARLLPREALLPEGLAELSDVRAALDEAGVALTVRPVSLFEPNNCRKRLTEFYKLASLEALGDFSAGELTAAGALLDYVLLTQVGAVPALRPVARQRAGRSLEIDAATRRNLELVSTLSGERGGSLLATIDLTVTAAGARLLAARLSAPLTEATAINQRLDSVGWAVEAADLAGTLRGELRAAADLERSLSRLALGRGGPRDLAVVRDATALGESIHGRLPLPDMPAELAGAVTALGGHSALLEKLRQALAAELPLLARDGGFIAPGYAVQLDAQVQLRDEGRRLIAALQARYLVETGQSSLKIKHNNIIGYHIELSAAQAQTLTTGPKATDFIHRQTMAGTVRFTTTELVQLERDLSQAAERALAVELELFEDLRQEVLARQVPLAALAEALALLDVTLALAELARVRRWVRPEVGASLDFAVTGGRHPVVEAALKASAGPAFVPNDCALTVGQRLWLLTGPNMAGKSTFLRQNALLVVLAQMGAFVPAAAMKLGVVDRLFSRVGAADDLARGRSTFMVEMVETASILNRASERSLVILDEIGRGTATYDGLSIAWAVVEHLHNVSRCRGLFATHYHELTALEASLPELACYTLKVTEWQGKVIFQHEVEAGRADRSYGLHVAQLAGLPEPVLVRAAALLAELEAGKKTTVPMAVTMPASPRVSPVVQALRELEPDRLSPREALEALYRLKDMGNA